MNRSKLWWLLLAASLGGFAAFMVLRPLAGGGYYRPRPLSTSYAYAWVVIGLFVPYGMVLWGIRRGSPTPSLRAIQWLAAAVSLALMVAPLMQSQDLYQYLFYAKMQLTHGANPYVVPPRHFAADPWLAFVGWPQQVSVYGPLWSVAMLGVVGAAKGSLLRAMFMTKALVVALGAVTVGGLRRLRPARPGEPPRQGVRFAVAAFALNPLILSTLALSGHADAAVAALFVWAIVADRSDRPMVTTVLLASAALVKAYAGAPLVVYLVARWRRDGPPAAVRSAAASVALAAAAFAPYWAGLRTFRGITSIAGETSKSLAGSVAKVVVAAQRLFDRDAGTGFAGGLVRVLGVLVVSALVVALARSRRTGSEPWRASLALMAGYIAVTPWFLPWHVVGLVALAAAVPESPLAVPALTFSGSCMAFIGGPGVVGPVATATARYGPPVVAWRRRPAMLRAQRPAAPARSVTRS